MDISTTIDTTATPSAIHPRAQLPAAIAVDARKLVFEERAIRNLDLGGRARPLEPEHDTEPLVRDQIFACIDQVLDELWIEVAFAKLCRIAVIEHLLDRAELDIDDRLVAFGAIPRTLLLARHCSYMFV
jgi:hypothetical protein